MAPTLTFKPEQIRSLREALGLSLKAFGERCGVSPQAVASWEAGDTRPTVDNLLRIVNMTGATIESFFIGRAAASAARG